LTPLDEQGASRIRAVFRAGINYFREVIPADVAVDIIDYHYGMKAMARPAIHPGEILADELEELSISPTELARQINVPANRITQIIQGKRALTGDTALRLGHWFGTSAQFWLNLQSAHDIRVAAQQVGAEIKRLPTRAGVRAPARKAG
jgi:addiction module HigA family antidote